LEEGTEEEVMEVGKEVSVQESVKKQKEGKAMEEVEVLHRNMV
tara:strand:+ start:200 stop:328 length:129 start_codon:yes stop_codon:yes gene_type:complete